jgi:anti-sigma regulatory factor (Ser/Thr protein kinase)/GNAT superfamily N-acetyltransferase
MSNQRSVLPSVRALTNEALAQLSLTGTDAEALTSLVAAAVDDAVDHAYLPGEEGSIKLVIHEQHGKLEIRVRDYGMPQDVEALEARLHGSDQNSATLFGCHTAGLVDEMHWLAFGPQGKALQLHKWLHTASVAEGAEAASLAPFQEDAPLAPEQEYVVRRMRPEEAIEVSQLMYRTYGSTYFNADIYYPQRVAAQNANGSTISFVAQAADGTIAGHHALEMNQAGPIAESGQAAVDPAHRGRGLLNRLKNLAYEEARRRDLTGCYGDAVSVHTITQQSNRNHGGCLTCVDLAISPKTEVFRGFALEQPQRVTCLMYFHWLKPAVPRTIYVPARHQEIVSTIYENLGCACPIGEARAPFGQGTLAVKVSRGAAGGSIRVDRLGADTVRAVQQAKRDLLDHALAEVVFVDLPLQDSGTPHVAEALEGEGFGLAGVAPHFSPGGDLLRLIYLVHPLVREPIKTLAGFETRLVDYALADQTRVRATV